ncbi:uncharacterized protein LOC142174597 [Nicotiana tabacum]|uniref:Uncharacterized protein LOC142174597 n=1 Tax=Nicotiana tabacum TaxID=4097 RepID=A0AC58TH16_TOBAC
MCRMSTTENKPFTALKEIPLQLHMWWNDLEADSRKAVIKNLGGLVGLLDVEPKVDVIKALVPFWDPAHNIFRFSDFELTPTLEEMAGYAGLSPNFRTLYPLAPRPVTSHKFLDLLSISRNAQEEKLVAGYCAFQFLYRRYGNPRGFEEPKLGLTHAGNKDKWEARRVLAFMVAFMGVVVCPREDGHIEIGLAGMLDVATKRVNDTMHEHLCHRVGYMNYGLMGLSCIEEFGTQITGIEFPEGTEAWLSLLRSLTADKIEWTLGWLPDTEAIYTSAEVPYILLMGVRSIQPYAPYRVLRQLGRF